MAMVIRAMSAAARRCCSAGAWRRSWVGSRWTWSTLDLRGHADARVGDEVVAWGRGLPVEHVAESAETIGYELVCGMTRRVRFVEDDAPLP